MKKKDICIGMVLAIAAIVVVVMLEELFNLGYTLKTVIKVVAFMGSIVLYSGLTHKKFVEVIRFRKMKNIKPILISMAIFFVGTALAFLIFRRFIDLNNIRQSLIAKENLTRSNCLFVFAYIIVCNSFLEESFFRGYINGIFKSKKLGAIISAILFSIYHIGIFVTWFNPFIFIICMAGLTGVGLFLQWLSNKFESILASYITHACANVVINIIGALIIFEVI